MPHKLGKILVVDDEEDTALLVSDGLRRRGYDSAFVTSGSKCLDYLRTTEVDVVITDVQMPGMSGIELCEQLRSQYPACVPIVLTGYGTGDVAIEASRAGAFDFMTKPAKIEAIASTIDRMHRT